MTSLKLTYFNLTGRAEPVRLSFLIAGIPFEDERITREDWAAVRNDRSRFPLGHLPALTVGDLLLNESLSIYQFAASLSGLHPQDPLHAAQGVEVMVTIMEILDGSHGGATFGQLHRETDEEKKKVLRGRLAETAEFYLARVERLASRTGWAAGGDSMSFADLVIYNVLLFFPMMGAIDAALFEQFPTLCKIRDHVKDIPQVKQHNESGKGYPA